MRGIMAQAWGAARRPDKKVRVIVYGHQKAGTTAIAALLGKLTGQSVSIDPLYKIDYGRAEAVEGLLLGSTRLPAVCRRHSALFCHAVVKDPDLIFLYEEAHAFFSGASSVFVVRDPRDTIRSICNRLGLQGSSTGKPIKIQDMDRGNRHWAMMLSGHLPTIEGVEDSPNFVVNLANRWKLASDIYAQNTDNMILVKYEDFKKDKEGEIAALANSLGMAGMDPIAQHVDIQYQPKGKVDVDILQFFGRENLNAIENICGAHMRHFGYV